MPDCSTGAVTIKMISSTSTISTKGVMLISDSEVSVRPLLVVNAISALPQLWTLLFGDIVSHSGWSRPLGLRSQPQQIPALAAEVKLGASPPAKSSSAHSRGHSNG